MAKNSTITRVEHQFGTGALCFERRDTTGRLRFKSYQKRDLAYPRGFTEENRRMLYDTIFDLCDAGEWKMCPHLACPGWVAQRTGRRDDYSSRN